MERLAIPWIGKGRGGSRSEASSKGVGSLSILMDSHIEEAVAPNLVLRSPALHMGVQNTGPGAVKAGKLLPSSCLGWWLIYWENSWQPKTAPPGRGVWSSRRDSVTPKVALRGVWKRLMCTLACFGFRIESESRCSLGDFSGL